MFAEFQVSA